MTTLRLAHGATYYADGADAPARPQYTFERSPQQPLSVVICGATYYADGADAPARPQYTFERSPLSMHDRYYRWC